MSLVVDSSVTLAWFFADERSTAADAVLRQVAESGAVAPSLWRLEVANALQMAVLRKRVDAAFRDASLADLRALEVEIDSETDRQAWTTTLELAARYRLTLYDAAYLELAQRLRLPLASLDRELRAAGKALGMTLLGK
ncbi:MAG: type II toxin-antitoxin system VapC family toxin [Burkholderiaceae bacterium]